MISNSNWQQSLWDFAVKTYSSPQVEELSLSLQNNHQANINVLLWCQWLQEEKICIARDALPDVLEIIDTVSKKTVTRLREVRRELKELGGFTRVQAEMISKHILNAELMVEKVLLHRLQDLTRRFIEVMPDSESPLRLVDYLEYLKVPSAAKVAENFWATCMVEGAAEQA